MDFDLVTNYKATKPFWSGVLVVSMNVVIRKWHQVNQFNCAVTLQTRTVVVVFCIPERREREESSSSSSSGSSSGGDCY